MKKLNSLAIAFGCLIPFAVSAQWVQAPNGDLSTSKNVSVDGNTYLDGEVHINATWAPLSMKTGIQGIIDLTLIQNASVGYIGGDHYNFVSGVWSGINGSGPRPALRVGKVAGAEWTLIGYMSTAIGEDVGAQGNYTFSIGYGSRANGDYSVAMGGSTANGEYATALGKSSTGADYAFAAGDAHAGGRYSVALNTAGTNAGDYSTAINSAYSDGDYSFAAGNSYTHGKYSTALGQAQTTGAYSFAAGYFSGAHKNNAIALGTYVDASGENSIILGSGLDIAKKFVNKIDNSLMIGFNSAELPSVFVGPRDEKNEKTKFGFVGIGTTTPSYELSVNGTIAAKTALLVENLPGQWPDYVFDDQYRLMPLHEVESFIEAHHHLPGVPSQQQIESEGLNVGQMNMIIMQKIEELTLHVIRLEKENNELQAQVGNLQTGR